MTGEENGRVPSEPGCEPSASASQEAVFAESHPSREDAATVFDPWVCQWCGETGFDLRGLAQHVWQQCEVVERLADENIEDVRAWHLSNWEAAQARKALCDTDGSPEGTDPKGQDGEAATAGAAQRHRPDTPTHTQGAE